MLKTEVFVWFTVNWNNVRSYKFLAKYLYQYFQIFFIFIDKRFDKEREKTIIQQSIRKEELRKAGLCFIAGCFIKPFKIIINFFLFLKLICSVIFAFWYQGYQKKKLWRQIARNGKLNTYFKNNFNVLVMNVTQLHFLNRQNVHIWHFIKVNHKRSSLFCPH